MPAANAPAAEEALEAADADIREHEVTVGDWQRRREAFEIAETHYETLAERRRELNHQWRELERIRRVAQPARRYREIEAELSELGETPALDPAARPTLASARETIESARAAIASIQEQIARIDTEIETLTDDPALLSETGPPALRAPHSSSRRDPDSRRPRPR